MNKIFLFLSCELLKGHEEMFGWYDLNIQYRKLIKAKNYQNIFPRKNGLIRDQNPAGGILNRLLGVLENNNITLNSTYNPIKKILKVQKPENCAENAYSKS